MIFDIPAGTDLAGVEAALINALRAMEGLPPKSTKTKQVFGETVYCETEGIQITEMKDEGDFLRCNLNGGDSWAYYIIKSRPEIIHSFKSDDEKYLLKEVDANLFHDLKVAGTLSAKQAYDESFMAYYNEVKSQNGKLYFAFRDEKSDAYYVGFHDFKAGTHHFHIVKSKERAFAYLNQHGAPVPKQIISARYEYDPTNPTGLSLFEEHPFINKFLSSRFLRKAVKAKNPKIPKSIKQLILHLLGNDKDMFDHLINALAVIFQYRVHVGTAFVFQGVTGTGKGLLFNRVLRPLFGEDNFKLITLNALEENFNAFMENTLILCIDEVDTDQVRNSPKLLGRIKNYITEPTIELRAMYCNTRTVTNHTTIFMASNHHNPFRIEQGDRRFNVCERQEKKLFSPKKNKTAEVTKLQIELQDFANYLYSIEADIDRASEPIENDAKRRLQEITATSAEAVAKHLRAGDLAFLLEHLPPPKGSDEIQTQYFDNVKFDVNRCYRKVCTEAIEKASYKSNHTLSHAELFSLFKALTGSCPDSKVKLASYLGKIGLTIKPHNVGGKTVRGFRVSWKCTKSVLTKFDHLLTE